jgi:hypothetical protein
VRWLVTVGLSALLALAGCSSGSDNGSAGKPRPTPIKLFENVTAEQVVDAFVKAGFPMAKRKDETAHDCPKLGCEELVSTAVLTVMRFGNEDAAKGYAAKAGEDAYRRGTIVLWYAPRHTSHETREEYENVLATMKA